MSRLRVLLSTLFVLLALPGCYHALQPLPEPAPNTALPQTATPCPEPRPQPGQQIACPMNYLPVCAIHADGSRSSPPNACSACANPEIIGYTDAQCP